MEKERKRNENQYNSHHDRFPRAIKYSNKNIFTNQDWYKDGVTRADF